MSPDKASRSKKKAREPRLAFRAVCTVPTCEWAGEPAPTEKRAAKSVGEHARERHVEIRSVLVRRVTHTEVVDA